MRMSLFLASAALVATSAFGADLKYTMRTYMPNGVAVDEVFYMKEGHLRFDHRSYVGGEKPASFKYGPHLAEINDCDGKRMILNLDRKLYFVLPTIKPAQMPSDAKVRLEARSASGLVRSQPIETTDVTVEELGNQRDFHGHAAWQVRETRAGKYSGEGKSYSFKNVIETWYIDPPVNPCTGQLSRFAWMAPPADISHETWKTEVKRGMPIAMTTVSVGPGGTGTRSSEEIVDWSEAALPDSIFEVPAGFHETKKWIDVQPELVQLSLIERVTFWLYRLFH